MSATTFIFRILRFFGQNVGAAWHAARLTVAQVPPLPARGHSPEPLGVHRFERGMCLQSDRCDCGLASRKYTPRSRFGPAIAAKYE